ncbi:MAG: hypothetical protein L0332_01720 [Chloroflexi bacterium]|nr:hypothetical protein [Chloroflexota bacterium]MCI0577436.1 hypothetical protein [Chloroflexota bacterium]MCI0649704.1 hypothetical protein [Chloroflexota bacterium]MCI0725434.1 hypothetical protein [Chloroflexota bacterium]
MEDNERSLKSVVGSKTYAAWVDMLRHLVPDGRTHRLAPLVAGMLQYAVVKAGAEEEPDEESVAYSLLEAAEAYDPEEASEMLFDVIERLFADAGVGYERTNARGQGYSIADEIVYEFVHWFDMPWEA